MRELRTGERKEGAYFAAWNFVQKAAGGLSIAIAGVTLELAGVHAGGDVDPLGVRLVSSALPAFCLAGATLLLAGLHFGESEHRAVCEQLREIPRDESGQLLIS